MFIVDAHLDLAFNVSRGRDVTQPAVQQPVADNEIATVGLPDLRDGRVGLICATIFCEPRTATFKNGYTTPDEAHAIAQTQLSWYREQFQLKNLRLVKGKDDLVGMARAQHGFPLDDPRDVSAILLLEGADPIRGDDDIKAFHDAGVRIVGMAWKRTSHAGGTGEPGGLSELGRRSVRTFDQLGILHDTSHLAEQAFWELFDLTPRPVIASHSNCRAFVPTDRQLSDDMIKAIAARGGVIGINFFHKFLLRPEEVGRRRATLADVVAHMKHICDLTGSARHVAIGTDMDGGLGREQIPEEIVTSADIPKVGDALNAAGFGDDDVRGILAGNWLAFFAKHLR
jgi:membrane dipeptidase